MKEFFIPCDCGAPVYISDHNVVFAYDDEDPDDDQFCIYTGMSNYLPWYKRLVLAVKYVLGINARRIEYVETIIERKDLEVILEKMMEETG